MSDPKQPLALFDFDKTLTDGDSFYRFIVFTNNKSRIVAGFISLLPWLAGYKAGILSNNYVKEKVIRWFFKGEQKESFSWKCREFVKQDLVNIEKKVAMERLNWHQKSGHKIIVVSASIEDYLHPWCNIHNIEGIGTKLETENGRLTGNFATPNCYGYEKIRRLQENIDLEKYHPVYAYGDSPGDYEMLALADYPYFRTFKDSSR